MPLHPVGEPLGFDLRFLLVQVHQHGRPSGGGLLCAWPGGARGACGGGSSEGNSACACRNQDRSGQQPPG